MILLGNSAIGAELPGGNKHQSDMITCVLKEGNLNIQNFSCDKKLYKNEGKDWNIFTFKLKNYKALPQITSKEREEA